MIATIETWKRDMGRREGIILFCRSVTERPWGHCDLITAALWFGQELPPKDWVGR